MHQVMRDPPKQILRELAVFICAHHNEPCANLICGIFDDRGDVPATSNLVQVSGRNTVSFQVLHDTIMQGCLCLRPNRQQRYFSLALDGIHCIPQRAGSRSFAVPRHKNPISKHRGVVILRDNEHRPTTIQLNPIRIDRMVLFTGQFYLPFFFFFTFFLPFFIGLAPYFFCVVFL